MIDPSVADLIVKLLAMAKANEWQYRNAAENRYCPYCATDDEQWCDQQEHHEGCQFVAVVAEAEQWLDSYESSLAKNRENFRENWKKIWGAPFPSVAFSSEDEAK